MDGTLGPESCVLRPASCVRETYTGRRTQDAGLPFARAANEQMTQYIIRRFVQMIPIAFGILTLVFSLIHLIPGDPAIQIAGEGARPEDVVAVRKALGLDQPLWTQYVHYLTSIIRGDLGKSFQTNESVTVQIRSRYPATMQLAFGAMLIALLV